MTGCTQILHPPTSTSKQPHLPDHKPPKNEHTPRYHKPDTQVCPSKSPGLIAPRPRSQSEPELKEATLTAVRALFSDYNNLSSKVKKNFTQPPTTARPQPPITPTTQCATAHTMSNLMVRQPAPHGEPNPCKTLTKPPLAAAQPRYLAEFCGRGVRGVLILRTIPNENENHSY